MKLAAVVILSGIILFLGTQIYSFIGREREAGQAFSDLKAKLDKAKIDQQKLQNELKYYSNQANVEKELKGRFSYKAPNEKLMIIVPQNQSTTATTTAN